MHFTAGVNTGTGFLRRRIVPGGEKVSGADSVGIDFAENRLYNCVESKKQEGRLRRLLCCCYRMILFILIIKAEAQERGKAA